MVGKAPEPNPVDLVVLGAGASFGSDTANTPPLGPDLFRALQVFSPTTWGALDSSWSAIFQEDFEKGMVALINAGIFVAPLQWHMAAYFFTQFRVREGNLYVRLLKALRPRHAEFAVVTINYDPMLFQAARLARITCNIGGCEPEPSTICVCLPHGNCVLYCKSIRAGKSIKFSYGISTGGQIAPFRDIAHFYEEMLTNSFPPVMSYYEPRKFTASCGNFIKLERKRFQDLVSRAHRIAMIGLRVHETDDHIWGPLSATGAPILYVAGSSGKREYEQWCGKMGRSQDTALPKYFQDGFHDVLSFFNL